MSVETGQNNVSNPVEVAAPAHKSQASPLAHVSVLLMGIYLGVIFVKSEVASWQRIHDMFLFRERHMYLIIGIGIAVAMVSMWFIKRFDVHTVAGEVIEYKPKPFHTGVIIGGMIFGAGWAVTGACPGPIYAQIGAGEWMASFTLIGALAGMFGYAALRSRLPH